MEVWGLAEIKVHEMKMQKHKKKKNVCRIGMDLRPKHTKNK